MRGAYITTQSDQTRRESRIRGPRYSGRITRQDQETGKRCLAASVECGLRSIKCYSRGSRHWKKDVECNGERRTCADTDTLLWYQETFTTERESGRARERERGESQRDKHVPTSFALNPSKGLVCTLVDMPKKGKDT